MSFDPPTQTGVDDVHAHPRHVGHRSIDLILALTAIFISGVSLYVAMEHGRTERELVRENAQLVQANSWPFLQLESNYSSTTPSSIVLDNTGIGPAKLETLLVFYRDKVEPDVKAPLTDCCGLPADPAARDILEPHGISLFSPVPSVLRPGTTRPLIVVGATAAQNTLGRAFLAASGSIRYEACYCSVFDACWISDLKGLTPKPVARCPVVASSFNDGFE